MKQDAQTGDISTSDLYKKAEAAANKFNLNLLALLCVLAAVSNVLNVVGIFHVEPALMNISMVASLVFFSVPLAARFVHDDVKKSEEPILENDKFKVLILVCAFLGLSIICITLTQHGIALMALLPLIAAQYRDQKRLYILVLVLSVLLVFLGVYGGYFYGTYDRNIMKGLSEEALRNYRLRAGTLTRERAVELLFHYVVPRIFGVVTTIVLAAGVTHRNSKMLKAQAELSEQVRGEMERKNVMQRRVIDDMATLIETRDVDTGEHLERTKRYVEHLARQLSKDPRYASQLDEHRIHVITDAAVLHDIGKIAVSDRILLKPGKLTSSEFDEIKKHTEKGSKMVRQIFGNIEDEEFLSAAEEIALSHHERWDGAGYPQGLVGEEIPLAARIMAVADVYDALVSERVYKQPITPEEAFRILEEESGSHFDPSVIAAMSAVREEFDSEPPKKEGA